MTNKTTHFLSFFFLDISINQFKGIDTLSLTNLRAVNLFVGRNGCGKTSILEAINEQAKEVLGDCSKSMWNQYEGVKELNTKKLESLPKEQFPVILLIDNIEIGLHHTEFSRLWISLIDFAILHSVQLFVTTHSYDCIEGLVDVCRNRYPGEDLVRLFRIEKKKGLRYSVRHEACGFTQEQLAIAIERRIEIR